MLGFVSGKKYIRQSIIAGRRNDHSLIAPIIYSGTADTELILYWVKTYLLSSLKPNSILVWDNAAIHKSKLLEKLVTEAGHKMVFLPPYSPDLNPIEHKWQELKHNLASYYDSTIDFLDNLINQVNKMTVWE